MAAYKALVSFSGRVSMAAGEVKEIKDQTVVNDLLKAGYIKEAVERKPRGARSKVEK